MFGTEMRLRGFERLRSLHSLIGPPEVNILCALCFCQSAERRVSTRFRTTTSADSLSNLQKKHTAQRVIGFGQRRSPSCPCQD